MQVEIKILSILGNSHSVKDKVEEITSFMNWDKDKLINAINKHGTGENGRPEIIKTFWRKKR